MSRIAVDWGLEHTFIDLYCQNKKEWREALMNYYGDELLKRTKERLSAALCGILWCGDYKNCDDYGSGAPPLPRISLCVELRAIGEAILKTEEGAWLRKERQFSGAKNPSYSAISLYCQERETWIMRNFAIASERFGYKVIASIHDGCLLRGNGHREMLMDYCIREPDIGYRFPCDDYHPCDSPIRDSECHLRSTRSMSPASLAVGGPYTCAVFAVANLSPSLTYDQPDFTEPPTLVGEISFFFPKE